MSCAKSFDDAGKMTLNVTKAYPGTYCDVSGRVQLVRGASEPGEVTGVDLNLPNGWTAALRRGCGELVDNDVSGPGFGTEVTIRVTMTEQATPGSGGTFAPSDGVKVAPVCQDAPSECDPA